MPSSSKAQAHFQAARLARDLKAGRITKAEYDRKMREWMRGYSRLPTKAKKKGEVKRG